VGEERRMRMGGGMAESESESGLEASSMDGGGDSEMPM
jgi:hypothetical protein